jgi:membrane associated rhomboid family serine protease
VSRRPVSQRTRPPGLLQQRLKHARGILPGLILTLAVVWIPSLYGFSDHNLIYALSLIPRSIQGINGILTMPMVHGSMEHLLVNTSLLVIFAAVLLWRGYRYYLAITLLIQLVAGTALWIVGREGAHIGASMLIFGYFGLLATRGLFERQFLSIAVSLCVVGIYSGLLWGIIPEDEAVSWEGHLLGLLAGVFIARLLSPKVQHK